MTASSRPAPNEFPADPIQRDWRMLAATIGERRAGTAEERRAAEFIAQRFGDAGLEHVVLETFPCPSLHAAEAEVHARHGRELFARSRAVSGKA